MIANLTKSEQVGRNLDLLLALYEDGETFDGTPANSHVVLIPRNDQSLAEANLLLAGDLFLEGQTVYFHPTNNYNQDYDAPLVYSHLTDKVNMHTGLKESGRHAAISQRAIRNFIAHHDPRNFKNDINIINFTRLLNSNIEVLSSIPRESVVPGKFIFAPNKLHPSSTAIQSIIRIHNSLNLLPTHLASKEKDLFLKSLRLSASTIANFHSTAVIAGDKATVRTAEQTRQGYQEFIDYLLE